MFQSHIYEKTLETVVQSPDHIQDMSCNPRNIGKLHGNPESR